MDDLMKYENEDIEVDGVTVEDAVKKALKMLKLPRESVEIKIVCEEKKGLFGMEGAKPAKVRIKIKRKN